MTSELERDPAADADGATSLEDRRAVESDMSPAEKALTWIARGIGAVAAIATAFFAARALGHLMAASGAVPAFRWIVQALVGLIVAGIIYPIATGLAARPVLLAKNLVTFVIVVWIIATVTFFLAKQIPGGPFTAERQLPPAIRERIEAQYDLDKSLLFQYRNYLYGIVTFDLGPSFYESGRTVTEIIGYAFPNSLRLGLFAILIAIGLGVPLGVLAALKQNQWQDYTSLGVVVLGVSVPSFIFATLLQYIFSLKANMLPASGLRSWTGYIMPSLSMATLAGAFIIRLVRSEMIDVLSSQYITAAKARGLSTWKVVWKHALRNALLPVVTYLGPVMAGLFTGSFVIETIFVIPGLGQKFVQAIGNRDYNLILGVTVFYSSLLVGMNMVIDSVYRIIDPRVGEGDI